MKNREKIDKDFCFDIPKERNFDPEMVRKKRQKEKIIFAEMTAIFCKKHKHQQREVTKEDLASDEDLMNYIFKEGKSVKLCLCEECLSLVKESVKHTERCPHMGYKTFCNRCPTPCYRGDLKARMSRVMVEAGKGMLLQHPILSIKHFISTFSGIIKAKKRRKEKNRESKLKNKE